jgi:hypothetical protein
MNSKYKTHNSLEQYLRRKKVEKPGKHAGFFLSLFLDSTLNRQKDDGFYIYFQDIKNAGLIASDQKFELWRDRMIINGILISNDDENFFVPSNGILNYLNKEKLYLSKNYASNSNILNVEKIYSSDIETLKLEIESLKLALKETNRRIEKITELWKLRAIFALKKENVHRNVNTFQKKY